MIEPGYRITHIGDISLRASLDEQQLEFTRCSTRQCSDAPAYILYTHMSRRGPLHTRRQFLCPVHASRWCKAHHVAIEGVPLIPFWDTRNPQTPSVYWQPEDLP